MLTIIKLILLSILLLMVGCSSSSPKLFVKEVSSVNIKESEKQSYTNVWEALSNLDFVSLNSIHIGSEHKQFAKGLNEIKNINITDAEDIFRKLYLSTSDSTIRKNSTKILASLLFNQSRWEEILELDDEESKSDNTNLVLIKSFMTAKQEKYIFTSEPALLPFSTSSTGSPIVHVKINGKQYKFWLDTGAGLSVISSDVAEECGVASLTAESGIAGTGTSKTVVIKPAIINSLELGDVKIFNHPAIIIDERDLKFKLFGLFTVFKIDGIIGWNAIKNMLVSINYVNNELTISMPSKQDVENKNFFWLEEPYVSLLTESGEPLLFKLDSGGHASSITNNILKKINAQNVQVKDKTISSAGGSETFTAKVISELTLLLGKYSLNFVNISTNSSVKNTFISADGILGSDIFKNSVVTIDYLNGRFDFKYIESKN